MTLQIRNATLADATLIAQFNTAMALETENLRLQPERILAGARHLISHPELGFYLVAQRDAEVVASLLVTTEWSDWRNGTFWWIQSVYVLPQHRRQGVYSSLYQSVKDKAAKSDNVCGFRLYVEQDNRAAQATYRSLGMAETHYRIYEELKGGDSYFL